MKKFWKIFIVAVLLVATFVTTLIFGNTINNWFDKTFISKDSKLIGEWSVDNIEVSNEEESLELSKTDYEDFILEYDSSKATDLEQMMYSISTDAYAQSFTFKEDGTFEIYYTDPETGEKELGVTYNWTFEKGVVTLSNEETSFVGEYKDNSVVVDMKVGDDLTMTQTLKKQKTVQEDVAIENEKEEFSFIGEWNVTETKLETNTDSFTLKAEDYEEFKANYDESTASELESIMYDICDGMFLQKYVITEEKFEIHMFNGEEFECVGEFDYTINEDGNLEYSFDAEEDNMIVLIKDGNLINQQGSLDDVRISQIFSKNN